MSCPAYINALSQLIWNDLNQPADQTPSYIQTKLISPGYVGKLNVLTSECFAVSGSVITPELPIAAQAVYSMMYVTDYYTTKLNQALGGLLPGNGAVELAEGDSRIRFVNPTEVARMYKEMQKQTNEQLQLVLASYRSDKALPTSVNYPLIVNLVGAYGDAGYPLSPITNGPHTYYRN